jgi:hypothetical protein
MFASYLYLLLDIDSEDRFRMKLYIKGDNFNFPMVNIPFICSKIPAHADVYSWYNIPDSVFPITIFLIYSFLLITRRLMNQGFLVVKSSFVKPYGHLHNLINRYRMSVTDENGYVPFAVIKRRSLKIPKRSIKSVNRRTEKPMAKRKGQVNKLWSTKHYEET